MVAKQYINSTSLVTGFILLAISTSSFSESVDQYFNNNNSTNYKNTNVNSSNLNDKNPIITINSFDLSKLKDIEEYSIKLNDLEKITRKDQKENKNKYSIDRLEILADKLSLYYRKKGLILASVKMTILMAFITMFSGSSNTGDLFNQLTTIAVLLTMLPYLYTSINLIRFESMTTRNIFVMLFSGIACLFCLVALAGAESSALTGTFLVSLIILVFYGKKKGLSQTDPALASA